jgi:hypothetical protein
MAQIMTKMPELNINPRIILRWSDTWSPKSKGSAINMMPASVLLGFEILSDQSSLPPWEMPYQGEVSYSTFPTATTK